MPTRLYSMRITPSVLDRLFDDAPLEVRDYLPAGLQALERLRHAVVRDLEGLLNSRAQSALDLNAFPELARSVVNYGLPDFSTLSAVSQTDQARIRTEIQLVIARFEPRLKQVKVHLVQQEQTSAFSFRIEALLHIESLSEPVAFDVVLDVATQLYQIA